MYSHNHCTLIIDDDDLGFTVTVTALRAPSVKPLPDTDTWYVVVDVKFGEGVKVWAVSNSVPLVAALYHLKTGLVTELAEADSVVGSPLQMSVSPVMVIRSAELLTVIVMTLLGSEWFSSAATRRK